MGSIGYAIAASYLSRKISVLYYDEGKEKQVQDIISAFLGFHILFFELERQMNALKKAEHSSFDMSFRTQY